MASKKLSAQKTPARPAAPAADDGGKIVAIPLDRIRFDPTQPRQAFHHPDGQVAEDDEKAVQELADSIKSQGLIHPITVQPIGDGTHRVVVGERRTRAHLLLGRNTIPAKIRADLTDTKRKLIYQLAENVNRQDLTDAEMARSIRNLMEGKGEEAPMTQSQIAKSLGKSEGWVSRYVKFGDEEQQRLWIHTGIADTVEKLYRLSVLPMPVQADIQRRVRLPRHHPERLAKPLNRNVIDDLARVAKLARAASTHATPVFPPGATSARLPTRSGKAATREDATDFESAQLAQMAQAGREWAAESAAGRKKAHTTLVSESSGSTRYTLPAADRAAILAAANVTLQGSPRANAQPPVTVRVPVSSLQKLLRKLEAEDRHALAGVQLSMNLPGPLAERIANVLAGVMVDPSEVPAVVQTELVKLR
jgi:ParB/RepB/Spo0J family partition protein